MPRLESRDAVSVDSRAARSPKDACLKMHSVDFFFLIVLSISLLGGFLHFRFES